MVKSLLLLVDLQEDFLKPLGAHGEELQLEVTSWLQHFRDSDLPVAHVHTVVTLDPDNRMPHWKAADNRICLRGSDGAKPARWSEPLQGEPVFEKTYFSGFSAPGLSHHLQQEGIEQIVLAGVHTHACLKKTALDAYERGYSVCLAEGAVDSYDPLAGTLAEIYLANRGMGGLSLQDFTRGASDPETTWTHRSPVDESELWSCEPVRPDELNHLVWLCAMEQARWSRSELVHRGRVLGRFAELLATNSESLAELLVTDIGKPISHARGEVEAARRMVEAVVERFETDLRTSDRRWRKRPQGVIALITPFNNPLMIPVGKLVPALAFGNSVMWKPSPPGWRVALEVQRLLVEADMPEPLVTPVFGEASVGRALMEHPQIDAVTISGGMKAGEYARAICAARHRPLQAELGGNNAAIVWGEVEWPKVAPEIVRGAFGFAGQRCTANRRLIVAEEEFENALSSLLQALETYPAGDPRDPRTDCGPLISAHQLEKARNTLRLAESASVGLHTTSLVQPAGYYQAPTIFWDAEVTSRLVQMESFAPFLVIQKARDFRHALLLSKAVAHGLVASLFSTDPVSQRQFLEGAEAGILKFNQATHGADPEVPFGGWKRTGLGPPEHGPGDVEFYTKYQAIYRG